MTQTIAKKIVSYKVVNNEEVEAVTGNVAEKIDLETMHENRERPDILRGSTYKIKTPQSAHAMYITINDMILNADTEYEEHRPYEVFINSKNIENFQWVLALTRLISAVWRKGGDACFLVEELKSIFDPKGGYFKKGGVFMPSLVAEIGCVIEAHLKKNGVLKAQELDEHTKRFLIAKRKEFEAIHNDTSTLDETSSFPAQATFCEQCNTKAMVLLDGCRTCLNCGFSKCS